MVAAAAAAAAARHSKLAFSSPRRCFSRVGAPERSWLYLSMLAAGALIPTLLFFVVASGGACCGCADAALPLLSQRVLRREVWLLVAAGCFLCHSVEAEVSPLLR